MTTHALRSLLALAAAAAVAVPSPVLAASYAPDGSNTCLTTDLTVTTAASTDSTPNTVTATVVARGARGQRVSRLHLDLEVQQRTATAWVPLVTPGHSETYVNVPGSRIHRTWTLREDARPIDALLDDHVQVRIYAKFQGVCRGMSFGPPLLHGLTAPILPEPAAS
jgi:hypothetical protein